MKSHLFTLTMVAMVMSIPGKVCGNEQYTDKLVAIHYSESANMTDSTFEYDLRGNITLRSTENWREENSYDNQNRRIASSVYSRYYNEMRLEREQEWAFDSHGNECMQMLKIYAIESGELKTSILNRVSHDDRNRVISDARYSFYDNAWWLADSLSYTYDDEHCVWTSFEQNSNGVRNLYEHYCDEMGKDTLIYRYLSDIYDEEWKLVSRTIFSYCEYGETCQLTQSLKNAFWINSEKMETEYHNSADSYQRKRWYFRSDNNYSNPEAGTWHDGYYEYNYDYTGDYRHVWGNSEGHEFDDEYKYDDAGRVVWHHYKATSHSYETDTFAYDEWGNLVQKNSTDTMLSGMEQQTSYVYTYDDNGAILASEYWYKDYFDGRLNLWKTTVYEFDTSVPATSVLGSHSPYYKLLSVTETNIYDGKAITTTYEYAPVGGIEDIDNPTSAWNQAPAICYDLMGRRISQPRRLILNRKTKAYLY